jgi:hypothetical protein
MNKTLTYAVRFATFAARHKIAPRDLAELITLARRAFNAGERACNRPNTTEARDRACERFERRANELAFNVEWNGLAPTLARPDEPSIYLPTE